MLHIFLLIITKPTFISFTLCLSIYLSIYLPFYVTLFSLPLIRTSIFMFPDILNSVCLSVSCFVSNCFFLICPSFRGLIFLNGWDFNSNSNHLNSITNISALRNFCPFFSIKKENKFFVLHRTKQGWFIRLLFIGTTMDRSSITNCLGATIGLYFVTSQSRENIFQFS